MSRVFSLFFIHKLLPHGWLPHKAIFSHRAGRFPTRYGHYTIVEGRGQGSLRKKSRYYASLWEGESLALSSLPTRFTGAPSQGGR